MSDRDQGIKVLRAFWKNSPSLNLSFEAFLQQWAPDPKKREIYIDGIGLGAREMSDSRVETAMRNMAIQARGRVPSNWQDFFKFLQNEAVKINWLDAGIFTLKESGKDILKGAEAVGKSVIFTGKILNFLLPAIAIFLVLYLLNKYTEGGVAKAYRGMKT